MYIYAFQCHGIYIRSYMVNKRAEFYQGLNTAHTCTCIRIYFEWNNPVYM